MEVRPGRVAGRADEARPAGRPTSEAPGTTFGSSTERWQYVQTWPSKARSVKPMPQRGSGAVQARSDDRVRERVERGARGRGDVDGRIVVVGVRGEDLARAAADREDVAARVRRRAEELRRRGVERRRGRCLLRAARASAARRSSFCCCAASAAVAALRRSSAWPARCSSARRSESSAALSARRLPARGDAVLTANRRLERDHPVACLGRRLARRVEVHLQPVEREGDRLIGAVDVGERRAPRSRTSRRGCRRRRRDTGRSSRLQRRDSARLRTRRRSGSTGRRCRHRSRRRPSGATCSA